MRQPKPFQKLNHMNSCRGYVPPPQPTDKLRKVRREESLQNEALIQLPVADSEQPEIFMARVAKRRPRILTPELVLIEVIPSSRHSLHLTENEAMELWPDILHTTRMNDGMPSTCVYTAIQNALQCFVPLPVHLDLEQRFSRMIRAGYQNRNPFSLSYWRNLD